MSSIAKQNGLTDSNVRALKFIMLCEIKGCLAFRIGQKLFSGSDRVTGHASLQVPARIKLRDAGLITWKFERVEGKKPWIKEAFCSEYRLTEKGRALVHSIVRAELAAK